MKHTAALKAPVTIKAPVTLEEILNAVTTEEALAVVNREGLTDAVMAQITARIHDHLHHRAASDMLLGAVIYSNQWGYLGQTESAEELTRLLCRQYAQKEGEE